MIYSLPSLCPIFKKDYKYKIKLFGAYVDTSENKENKKNGKFIDLYMKSHNKYFILKSDFIKTKGKDDELILNTRIYDEFGYSRLPTNIIKKEENGNVTFPEVKYYCFPANTEIIFENIDIDNNKKISLNSNIASFSLLGGKAHSAIDLSTAFSCTRDELINFNFTGKEKDDIMEILIDNDKFQKQCFLRDLYESKGVTK